LLVSFLFSFLYFHFQGYISDFYTWSTADLLEIRPNANQEQITKAYRKKSRTIHPDKVKRAFIAN